MTRADKLAEQFEAEMLEAELTESGLDLRPRYNIAPSQQIAVVRKSESGGEHAGNFSREVRAMRWGLVPSWAKDPKTGFKMINARGETVLEKPAYREAFKRRRCLIPADGFYEWQTEGRRKTPFRFALADGSPFAFAGIWERWKQPDGRWLESCSILTTSANDLVRGIHDRMPVILDRRHYDAWLTAPPSEAERLCELLLPHDAAAMHRHDVAVGEMV